MSLRVSFALLLAALAAFAELAPEVYEKLRRESPEVLQLEIVGVDVDSDWAHPSGCGFFEFEVSRKAVVKAKVAGVVRSRAGVRAGDVIEIRYTSVKRCSGFNGAGPIPLVAERDRVQAWLAKGDRWFAPAARRESFEKWR